MHRFLDWLGVPIEWLCRVGIHGEYVCDTGTYRYWQCNECGKRWGRHEHITFQNAFRWGPDNRWLAGETDWPQAIERKLILPRGGSSTARAR